MTAERLGTMVTRADLAARNWRHGHAKRGQRSPEYRAWVGMIDRCEHPSHVGFKYYGARGIKVCERWRKSFEAFLADMGQKPPRLTLERIDADGDYEPGNCEWATYRRQRQNQRPYDESDRVLKAWASRRTNRKG